MTLVEEYRYKSSFVNNVINGSISFQDETQRAAKKFGGFKNATESQIKKQH